MSRDLECLTEQMERTILAIARLEARIIALEKMMAHGPPVNIPTCWPIEPREHEATITYSWSFTCPYCGKTSTHATPREKENP